MLEALWKKPPQVVPWPFRLTRQLGERYVLVIREAPHGLIWREPRERDGDAPAGSLRVNVDRIVEIVRAAMARTGISPGGPECIGK